MPNIVQLKGRDLNIIQTFTIVWVSGLIVILVSISKKRQTDWERVRLSEVHNLNCDDRKATANRLVVCLDNCLGNGSD